MSVRSNWRRVSDITTAALCIALDQPVPVDVEARLMEQGITLADVERLYVK